MDLYREEVMDHYEHPRNQGELSGECVMSETERNASCGDTVQFYLKIEGDVIIDVKWSGTGCAITSASASKLSEYLLGQSLKAIKAMSIEELAKVGVGFEVNSGRMKCLLLPVTAVKKMI
jgi:nitrogen fixation NifU-like protein